MRFLLVPIKRGLGGFADGSAARAASHQCWSEIVFNEVLVVASGGGQWIQLRRLLPAFDGFDVAYVSVRARFAVRGVGGMTRVGPFKSNATRQSTGLLNTWASGAKGARTSGHQP